MPVEKLVERFLPAEEGDADVILLLAGDISSIPTQLGDFLNLASARFAHVFAVPGNHEFYGQTRIHQDATVRMIVGTNAKVTYTGLSTVSLELQNATITGNTLWADGGRHDRELAAVSRGLYDFRAIKDEIETSQAPYTTEARFTVHTMREENLRFRAEFLEHIAAADPSKPLICISHHMPSYELCHPRFGGDIDGGFACRFDELRWLERRPDWWVFGHTHDTIHRELHDITMVSNPRGYEKEFIWDEEEHNTFAPSYIPLG